MVQKFKVTFRYIVNYRPAWLQETLSQKTDGQIVRQLGNSQPMWHTHAFPALRCRGRLISEFNASLVYRVNSRTGRAMQRNPVLKKKQNKQARCTSMHQASQRSQGEMTD